jgi:uncharacterized protein
MSTTMAQGFKSVVGAMLCGALLSACATTRPPEAPCGATTGQSSDSSHSAPASAPAASPRRLQIENSEILELSSAETGRDYQLIIGLPPSYANEPERRYPVLYLLDGQWDFNLVNTLQGGIRYDKAVPEFIVVGISYAGDEPDYTKLRRQDYTPTYWKPPEDEQAFGGDGPKFLAFLETKLLPTIEGRYRIDASQRMLSGSSAGGLFTLFALFEKPDLFQSYLALSPAAVWGDGYLSAREKEFHKTHPGLKKRVWLSIGSEEWPAYVKPARELFKQFEASRYEGIALRTYIVQGEHHAGNKPEAYNRALRFAFEPWAATQKRD